MTDLEDVSFLILLAELKDQGNNKAVPKESDEESSLKAATEQEDELEAAPGSEDGSDELKNNEEEKGGELKRKENDDKIDLDLNKFLGFQIDDDEDSDNENRLRQVSCCINCQPSHFEGVWSIISKCSSLDEARGHVQIKICVYLLKEPPT